MNLEKLGSALGRSSATVHRYCLRPGEPGHVHPPAGVGAAMKTWSAGFVHLGNCTDRWTPEIDAEWLAAGLYTPAVSAKAPEVQP